MSEGTGDGVGKRKRLEKKNTGRGRLTRSLCSCLSTHRVSRAKHRKRVGTLRLPRLPSLAGGRGKVERRRAEGGEREGMHDSSINAK